MKSWKKKWKDELDLYAGELSDDVKNAVIECQPNKNEKIPLLTKISNFLFNHKKPVFAGAFSLILVVILCFSIFVFPVGNKTVTTVLVEVNPALLLCADKNGTVVSLVSSNADGDVILSNKNAVNSLIGKDLKTAMTNYTDILNRLGYLKNKVGMRISGHGNNQLLNDCKSASENYLIDHGLKIAVVFQITTEEDLLNIANLNQNGINNISDLYKPETSKTNLYINGKAQGENSEQELEDIYSQIVEEDKVAETLASKLKNDKQELIALLEEIEGIIEVNDLIKNHEDNPSILGLNIGYWEIVNNPIYNPESFSTEFKTLINVMQDRLNTYETEHGTQIMGEEHLLSKKIYLSMLIEIIDFISSDEILEYLEVIVEFLHEINISVEEFDSLFTPPKNQEEYTDKLSNYYGALEQNNANNYNDDAPVSKEEYQSFLDEIIAEHGSLENFWKNSQNDAIK